MCSIEGTEAYLVSSERQFGVARSVQMDRGWGPALCALALGRAWKGRRPMIRCAIAYSRYRFTRLKVY
jgi:hypothetical protein